MPSASSGARVASAWEPWVFHWGKGHSLEENRPPCVINEEAYSFIPLSKLSNLLILCWARQLWVHRESLLHQHTHQLLILQVFIGVHVSSPSQFLFLFMSFSFYSLL